MSNLLTLRRPTPHRLRIIDGLIAEHLFGWKWFSALGNAYLIPPWGQQRCRSFSVHWTEGLQERPPGWSDQEKMRTCKKVYNIECHYSDHANWALPKFTTDQASAFQIIEELTRRYVTLNLMFVKPYWPQWQVQTAGANNLQLAVCLYALDRLDVTLPWTQKPKPRKKAALPPIARA